MWRLPEEVRAQTRKVNHVVFILGEKEGSEDLNQGQGGTE